MRTVTMLCHDSPTRDTCPALYRTDQGEYYVQGYTDTDADILTQMEIPEGEAVVRVTPKLLRMIAEAYGSAQPEKEPASSAHVAEIARA